VRQGARAFVCAPRVSLTPVWFAEELKDMAFQCVLMDDPVVAADGHTYNREDIENWFKEHSTSPHTNEQFEHKMLIPNIAIRRQISAWREQHGLPALSFAQPVKAQAQGGGGGGGAAGGGAQIVKPAAVCGFSKKALQRFCLTCKKGICINCAMDPARCHSHTMRPLDAIVCGIRESTRTLRGCRCARVGHSSCRLSAIELTLLPTLPCKPFERRLRS
jgi:hypothetical protein